MNEDRAVEDPGSSRIDGLLFLVLAGSWTGLKSRAFAFLEIMLSDEIISLEIEPSWFPFLAQRLNLGTRQCFIMAIINPDKFVAGGIHDIIWSCLELGIFIIFIIFGLYYLRSWVKTRASNVIQGHFNLAYTLFFLILSVNQLFYLADADVMFTELGPFLSAPMQIVLVVIGVGIYEPAFQIVYMFLLFLLPFFCIMFPTERYLLNRKKCPISILMAITIVLVSAMLVIAHLVPDVTLAGDALYNTLVVLHPAVVLCVLLSFAIGLIGGVWIYIMLG
ncbi:MAG: hypothetical protein Q6365_022965, partial [Candidatus Sigynarchaeota archaeon]